MTQKQKEEEWGLMIAKRKDFYSQINDLKYHRVMFVLM